MVTYPNQKVVHINKPQYIKNFLQVGIDEWQAAAKNLSAATFKVYLYLASNANGFDLALSPQAIEEQIGVSKSSYHRAIKELTDNGYITNFQGNIYNFYTKPR